MTISRRSLETLIDLVEIKLSCFEVFDRDDARERGKLENCLTELQVVAGLKKPSEAEVVDIATRGRGRGRRRAAMAV